MRTSEILSEILKLPFERKIYLMEKTLHSIRKVEDQLKIHDAAEVLFSEYADNKELTVFSCLDSDAFYETR